MLFRSPHALNELDDPVAVAVDSFGSVYIADLTGNSSASSATAFSRLRISAQSPEWPATRKGTSISPTFNTAWYGNYPPRPALKGPPTVPLHFRRLSNSRAEAPETDAAPPAITSRDEISPSRYLPVQSPNPLTLKPNLPLPPATGSVFQV